MKLLLKYDGGSRGNPGPAAYGYVIQDITSGAGIILEKCGESIGITTNNIADTEALLHGVKWVVDNKRCRTGHKNGLAPHRKPNKRAV